MNSKLCEEIAVWVGCKKAIEDDIANIESDTINVSLDELLEKYEGLKKCMIAVLKEELKRIDAVLKDY